MTTCPPMLLIAGWGATGQAWDALRAELPGAATRELGWAEILPEGGEAALEATLASAPEPWLLVGWSLGALLALRAALKYPARVRGLVLISGTARFTADGEANYPGADPRALRAMRARLPRAPEQVLEDFATRCAEPDGGEAYRERYLAMARQFSPEELARGLEALATLDLRAALPALAVPTLLVHGTADQIVPLESARALAAMAPEASLIELAGRGHALPLAAPAELAHILRSFTP